MNTAQREAIGNRLHMAVTLLGLWLVLTSPWVSMLRRVPVNAGFFNYAHMVLGVLALLCGLLYASLVVQGGRWKLYFPLAAGNSAAVGRDLGGLLRGKVPAAEGGGLFGAIEGLLLLAFIAARPVGRCVVPGAGFGCRPHLAHAAHRLRADTDRGGPAAPARRCFAPAGLRAGLAFGPGLSCGGVDLRRGGLACRRTGTGTRIR